MADRRKPALGFIFVTLCLDVLGLGLVIPVLPELVESLQPGGTAESAARAVGWLSALYALMQFLFAPVLGSLSDRIGRRPVILVSLLGSGLDYLLLAVAPTLPWFFLARAISGLTAANFTAATAYIADVSPPEKRAANFGIIGAAFGLGFVLGPALGGLLGQAGLRLPFVAAGVLTLVNWMYGYFVLPESLPREQRRAFSWGRANPVGSLLALRRFRAVGRLTVALLLVQLGSFCLHNIWVLYTQYRFGWEARQVGFSLTAVGLATGLSQAVLARRLIPALGERRAASWGLLVVACVFACYGAAPAAWMVYPLIVIGAVGGICGPALQALLSHPVPLQEQGALQGAVASLTSLAGVVAPVLATRTFAAFIGEGAPVELPGAPLFVSSLLVAAGWLVFVTSREAGGVGGGGEGRGTPA